MAEIIDLATRRALKPAARVFNRAAVTYDLLTGPITGQMIDALEQLTDPELEAFFRARARAALETAKTQ